MKILRWLIEEGKAIATVTLYFAACFIVIMLLKQLWLAEYGIEFTGIATALLAALVTAKVVIILDHLPLHRCLRNSPGVVEVLVRSTVYTLGGLLVMLLEKTFEARTEYGGVLPSLANVFEHRDMPNIWATSLAVGLSFLAYNIFDIMSRAIGNQSVVKLFFSRKVTAAQAAEGG